MKPIPGIRFKNKSVEVAVNSVLTQDDLRGIREQVVETMLMALRGRELLPVEKRPIQEEYFAWYLETQMDEAKVTTRRAKGRTSEDEVMEAMQTAIPYVKIEREFTIHRLDQYAKLDAKARSAKSAARQVAEAENDLIFNGCTLPAINGLIAGAGNTQVAAAVWSGFPAAGDPYEDVNLLIGQMRADGFPGPFSMAAEPTNYADLCKREVKTGGSARSMKELIEETLLGEPIKIDPSIPHGTAVVIQKGNDVAVLAVPEDAVLVIGELDEVRETMHGVVREAITPVIFQANGVGTVTGA
jgi:uncharacterized linocin/CFP29 family protein